MPGSEAPLEGLRLSLLGPGRVGRSLVAWAVARGARPIQVAARRLEAAAAFGAPLGAVPLRPEALESAGEDLLFLAVPDGALEGLAALLARRPQAPVVLHTAGSRDASVLEPLRSEGSAVGSFHPLQAFPEASGDPAAAEGSLFAVDGDPPARELGEVLARAWGARTVEISGPDRLLYHLAASLAAGGVVTAFTTACEVAARSHLPPEVLGGYLRLALGALEAAGSHRDPASALTGPVARGERELFRRQLEALRQSCPEAVPAVVSLARETLRQQRRLGPLGEAQVSLIEELASDFGRGRIP